MPCGGKRAWEAVREKDYETKSSRANSNLPGLSEDASTKASSTCRRKYAVKSLDLNMNLTAQLSSVKHDTYTQC